MGGRWLFILLCAILVQLGGSEDGVDEDGIRLTTISPDWTTKEDLHGGANGNGSEFTSAKKKIRRARDVVTKDEWDKGVEEFKRKESAKTSAKEDFEAAEKDFKLAEGVWNKTKKELQRLQDEYIDAETASRNANNTVDTADNILKNISKELETVTAEFNTIKQACDALNETYKAATIDYNLKKNNLDTANSTATKANDDAKYELDEWNKVLKTLAEEEEDLKAVKTKFDNANKAVADMNKMIQDHETYKQMEDNKNQANTNLTKIKQRLGLAEKARDKSAKRKTKIETSHILSNTVRMQWTTETVDGALSEWNQKLVNLRKDLANTTDQAKINKINDAILSADSMVKDLKVVQEINLPEKVLKVLVSKRAQWINEAEVQAKGDQKLVDDIVKEKDACDDYIRKMNENQANLIKPLTLNIFNRKYDDAVAAKSKIMDAFNKAKGAFDEKTNTVNTVKGDIVKKEGLSRNANETSARANVTLLTATTNEETSRNGYDRAKSAYDNYKRLTFDVANNKTIKLKEQQEEVKKNKALALTTQVLVKVEMDRKKTEVDAAILLVEEKRKIKEKAKENMDEKFKTKAHALDQFDIANTAVQKLEAGYKKTQEEEKSRAATLTALGTGLGITIAIIVLMVVGGVAFVLIKKRNKKKAADAAAAAAADFKAKEKAKIQYIPDPVSGLTILRKEGEEDRWVVMGEDIQVRGPLIHRRVHNNEVPLKHALDGQEGGDKIEKIFFAKELNEGFYIGEGVEIIEPDSVSVSEGKGAAKEDDLPINFGEDDDKYKKEETNSKKAVAAAPGVEDKKPTGSKKSSKSKRDANANAPVPKIPPPPPPPANALVKPPPAPPSSSSADEKKKK